MSKYSQLRAKLVKNIVVTPKILPNVEPEIVNSSTDDWVEVMFLLIDGVKEEKNKKIIKRKYQLFKALLGPTSGHYRDTANPAQKFILQNKTVQNHCYSAIANAINSATPILIEIVTIDKILSSIVEHLSAINDKSPNDIAMLNNVSATYHNFKMALSKGLNEFLNWRKDNDLEIEQAKKLIQFRKLKVSYKDKELPLYKDIKVYLNPILDNLLTSSVMNLPWEGILDASEGKTHKIAEQVNLFIERQREKILAEVVDCNNVEDLKGRFNKKVESFRKQVKDFNKKKEESDLQVSKYQKLVKVVLENSKNKEIFASHPLLKEQLDKSITPPEADKAFGEFYKSAAEIKDFNTKKKFTLQLELHQLDPSVKAALSEDPAQNIEDEKDITWTKLYAGFYHLKFASELQAELKTELQFYIKNILSKAKKDKIKIDEATNLSLKRTLRHLLVCLSKANELEHDQEVLTKLKAAILYLNKIKANYSPVKNLKAIIANNIEKIEAGEIAYLAGDNQVSSIKTLLEKERLNLSSLSVTEQYQLHWHYQNKLQTVEGNNYFEYLYRASYYLVLAAHGDNEAAKKRLGQKARIAAIDLPNEVENNFIGALNKIGEDSPYYAQAKVKLFVLQYGRRYKKTYSDYNERLQDLEKSFESILGVDENLVPIQQQILSLLGAQELDAAFLAKITMSLELAGYDPFAILYNQLTNVKESGVSPYPFQIKSEVDFYQVAKDLLRTTRETTDTIKELLNSRDELVAENFKFIRAINGRYNLTIKKEDLLSPIIFFDADTRTEIGRISYNDPSLAFKAYGNDFNIKLEGIDGVTNLNFDNPEGKLDLKANLFNQDNISITARACDLKYHGNINTAKNVIWDVAGVLRIAKDASIESKKSTLIKAIDCENVGKIESGENLSFNLQEALYLNKAAICSARKEIIVDSNAVYTNGGTIHADGSLCIRSKDSIYLKNTKVDSKENIIIDAKSLMTDGNTCVTASDILKITTADKWINEKATTFTAKTLQAKSKIIKNYSPNLTFDSASINATDCFTNYATGVINTQKVLQITGDNFWNSGKVNFGENYIVRMNKCYVHGIAETENLISYFKHKWESSGSLIEGKNVNIVSGAYINVCSLEKVRNRNVTALAEFNVAVSFSLFNNTTSILALNIGLDLPNLVEMYKDVKSFIDLVKEGKAYEALNSLCTTETAIKGASAVRWMLQTFLPKIGKPVNLTWSVLMLLINTPSVISQIHALYKQHQAGEELQPYQFYSLLNIAFTSLNQGLSINSQISNLSTGLGNSTIGNTNWVSAVGINLASLFMPMNVQNSLISVNVADVMLNYSSQNTSALSFSKWNVRAAMSISDTFYAASQNNIDVANQRAETANTLVENGSTYVNTNLLYVNNYIERGNTVANIENVQGINAEFTKSSEVKANTFNLQSAKQALLHGGVVAERANVKGSDVDVSGNFAASSANFVADNVHTTASSRINAKENLVVNADSVKMKGEVASGNLYVKAKDNLELAGNVKTGQLDAESDNNLTSKGTLQFDTANIHAQHVKDSSNITINPSQEPKLANPDATVNPSLIMSGSTVNFKRHLNSPDADIAIKADTANVSGKIKAHEIIIDATTITMAGKTKVEDAYLNASKPNGAVHLADSLKAKTLEVAATDSITADGSIKCNKGDFNTKDYVQNGTISVHKDPQVVSDNQPITPDVTIVATTAKITGNVIGSAIEAVQADAVALSGKVQTNEFIVNAKETLNEGAAVTANKVFLSTSAADGDIALSNSLKAKELSVSSGNTLEATGNLEVRKGMLHAKSVDVSGNIEIDKKEKQPTTQDSLRKLTPPKGTVNPDLTISSDTTAKLSGAIQGQGTAAIIADSIATSANIHTHKLILDAKTTLNSSGSMEFNKGSIHASSYTESGSVTVDRTPKLHPAPPPPPSGDQPLTDLTNTKTHTVNPGLSIQADTTSISGTLTGNGSVAIKSKDAEISANTSVHQLIVDADEKIGLSNTMAVEKADFHSKEIDDNAAITMPPNQSQNNAVVLDADTVIMGADSSIKGDGAAVVQAHTGNVTAIDANDVAIQFDHVANVEDLIHGRGIYSNVHAHNSLSIRTLDDVTLSDNLDINFSLAVTAARITLQGDVHSTKNLTFDSIVGGVETDKDKVMADGVLNIDSVSTYNNYGAQVGGGEMFVRAVDDINNFTGTLCSRFYLQLVSDTGSVSNIASQHDVKGPVGTMQAYQSGQIIGGTGEDHDGVGLHIEAGSKIINDASVISSSGSNYLKAVGDITSTARSNDYISYDRKWSNAWQDKETTVISAQAQKPVIDSANGKNTLISDTGKIYSCSTTFSAKEGNFLTAQGPITFTGLELKDICIKDSSAAFGLLNDNSKLTQQYAIPTVMVDMSNSSIVSASNVDLQSAVILSPGNLTILGQNVSISAPILNNKYTSNSLDLNLILPDPSSLPGYSSYQDLQNIFNSNNSVSTAAGVWNFGLDTLNLANNALTAYRSTNSLGSVASLFCPSVGVDLTYTQQRSTWQSVATNVGVQVGSLNITATDQVAFKNGVTISSAGDAQITAQHFVQTGAELKSSSNTRSAGINATINMAGQKSVGVHESSSESTETTFANQHFNVGGTLTTNVKIWDMKAANSAANAWGGEVGQLNIISPVNTSNSDSQSTSVATNGNFSVNYSQSKSAWISERSGIAVAQGINAAGGPQIHVGSTYLEGAAITSAKENNYKTDHLTTKNVDLYNKTESYGFSGNLNTLFGGKTCPSNISAIEVCMNYENWQARQVSTIFGKEGTNLAAGTINGPVNISNARGVDVTKDTNFQIDVKVPVVSPSAVAAIENNFEWLSQQLHPPVVQAPPAPPGNTPSGPRPLTDAERQNIALTEQVLAGTTEVIKQDPELNVSSANADDIREADQPAQPSCTDRWSTASAPQIDPLNALYDSDPNDYSKDANLFRPVPLPAPLDSQTSAREVERELSEMTRKNLPGIEQEISEDDALTKLALTHLAPGGLDVSKDYNVSTQSAPTLLNGTVPYGSGYNLNDLFKQMNVNITDILNNSISMIGDIDDSQKAALAASLRNGIENDFWTGIGIINGIGDEVNYFVGYSIQHPLNALRALGNFALADAEKGLVGLNSGVLKPFASNVGPSDIAQSNLSTTVSNVKNNIVDATLNFVKAIINADPYTRGYVLGRLIGAVAPVAGEVSVASEMTRAEEVGEAGMVASGTKVAGEIPVISVKSGDEAGKAIDNVVAEPSVIKEGLAKNGFFNGYGTSAYVETSTNGEGLGILENKEVWISEKGYDLVNKHLDQFGHVEENALMLERLLYALKNNLPLTGADASFYIHELTEATKMAKGMEYLEAHQFALDKYRVSPFSVYHPEVIDKINSLQPGSFNNKWIEFWKNYKPSISFKP